ncbi:hypothetical protein [Megamonas funiformis]|uniref:hypothetical protein n=1 Tax=Megamonas funiformis TaxID=437897 RepID=UPI00352172FB
MEDYGLLAILVFLIFLLTVGLIITKKVEFVRALPAFGIVTAILAGTPITGSEYSIADYVIAKGATTLAEPMFIYILSVMLAIFIVEFKLDESINHLCLKYLQNNLKGILWVVAILTIIVSSIITNFSSIILIAIIFMPILLKIGFNKQGSVVLLLLSNAIGSCLNSGYHILYANLLSWNIDKVKDFYYIMAVVGVIALVFYIFLNSKYVKDIESIDYEQKNIKVNWQGLSTIFIPFIAVFGFKLNIETGLILALSYGFLAMGSKQPFMDMLELLKVSIYKSTRVIILLSSVGIFMHAVKTLEVVDLMAPLLLHLMPKSPTQCLLFFTILSPLVLYKGPFNLQGMGAGLSAVIISSTSMNPMVLGMALLSLNNLRKMMDPLDVQNIALMQYVDVDTNLVIKKILPYALSINYIMLFYALVAVV